MPVIALRLLIYMCPNVRHSCTLACLYVLCFFSFRMLFSCKLQTPILLILIGYYPSGRLLYANKGCDPMDGTSCTWRRSCVFQSVQQIDEFVFSRTREHTFKSKNRHETLLNHLLYISTRDKKGSRLVDFACRVLYKVSK